MASDSSSRSQVNGAQHSSVLLQWCTMYEEQTDRYTHTDETDSITLTADPGGKNETNRVTR